MMDIDVRSTHLPRKAAPAFLLILLPVAAHAEELPGPVAEMIRTAVDSGDVAAANTVVRLAKKSNPQAAAEIDKLFANLKTGSDYRHRMMLRRLRFSQGWQGKAEFGATNTTGAVDSSGVLGALSLVRDGLRWKQSFTASVDYLHHDGADERDRYYAGHQVNLKFNDRLYGLGLVSWEGNRAQGFDSRVVASVGAGYSLLSTPKVAFSVEASPAVRETRYTGAAGGSSFAMRLASNYHWSVTPKLTVSADETFFQEGRNQTLTSESALTMKLIDALSARFSYRLQRESKPLSPADSKDTTSRVSLVYAF